MINITGYLNSDTIDEYTVERDGQPFDLTAAGVTRIQIVDEGVSIDSTTDSVEFTGSTLRIRWGDLALPRGTYSPTIYVYSPAMPDGNVLYGPVINPITLTLVEDERDVDPNSRPPEVQYFTFHVTTHTGKKNTYLRSWLL